MEPQFIINVGCLDKYNLDAKDFLELLDIDLKKVVPATKDFTCPNCNRTREDVHFVYHKYKDFKFGVNSEDMKADYSYTAINVYLCICGCLYYTVTEPSRISCDEEIIDEKKNKKDSKK